MEDKILYTITNNKRKERIQVEFVPFSLGTQIGYNLMVKSP